MSFLSRLLRKGSSDDKKVKFAKIVILGPSKSGKTTLVKFLEEGKPVTEDVRTTLGIDLREKPFKISNWEFTAIDVGGQKLYQKTFWNLGILQADSVIYMIDGLVKPDNPTFQEVLGQFLYMLNLVDETTPLLILVNKQDLIDQSPLSVEQAFHVYNIGVNCIGRSIMLLAVSAKFGNGVENAMQWIVERLESNQ